MVNKYITRQTVLDNIKKIEQALEGTLISMEMFPTQIESYRANLKKLNEWLGQLPPVKSDTNVSVK